MRVVAAMVIVFGALMTLIGMSGPEGANRVAEALTAIGMYLAVVVVCFLFWPRDDDY
ncbi:hypothetical protein [Actinokineospora sp.]|uniref:hypothetical protein n=1 Tax=Actinokineospora sp. TaxID=1872133 RepID=UPI003D6B4AE4